MHKMSKAGGLGFGVWAPQMHPPPKIWGLGFRVQVKVFGFEQIEKTKKAKQSKKMSNMSVKMLPSQHLST